MPRYEATGTKCLGKAQPGTRALRDALDELVPELGDYGIYNCRKARGGKNLSTHAEGRGWDAAINAKDKYLRSVGYWVCDLLIDLADELGIQRLIFNRQEWGGSDSHWAWEAYGYTGSDPTLAHEDHIHLELNWDGAKNLTYDRAVMLLKDAMKRIRKPGTTPAPTEEDDMRYIVGADEDPALYLTDMVVKRKILGPAHLTEIQKVMGPSVKTNVKLSKQHLDSIPTIQ